MASRGRSDIDALKDDLRVVRLGDPAPWAGLLEQLRRLGGFRLAMQYSIAERPGLRGSFSPHRHATAGPEADGLRGALVELLGARAIAYDPRKAEPRQRNRAHSLAALAHFGDAPPHVLGVYRRLLRDHVGLQLDQVRMLICEGATVLGWVGGFAPGETTQAQRALLTSLAPAFRERLRFEETLSRLPLAEAALDAVIESADGPAALVDSAGRPVVLNGLARERFDASPSELRRQWREATLGHSKNFRCVTLELPGFSRHHLLIARENHGDEVGRLVARAADWQLAPRETQVLALVVRGRTNEMIARDLDCAVRTVEFNVSRLLARAGVDNRASLIAKFWSEAKVARGP